MKRGATACAYLVGIATTVVLAGCTTSAPVYGLRPVHPQARVELWGPRVAFARVASLRPTLRWESFPTEDDTKADHEGLLGRIHNVTYDLKVFHAEHKFPTGPIYVRRGLSAASHRLETPLKLSTKYFWTVRARFELDGRPRATPWGRIDHAWSTDLLVPSPFYYGLETPAK